jgi:hypothetical protein
MPRFSRGVPPNAYRDLARIVKSRPVAEQIAILEAGRRLLTEMAVDPHLKGVARPTKWNPLLRSLDDGRLRLFYWVRQPPLNHLYAEAVGFSWI